MKGKKENKKRFFLRTLPIIMIPILISMLIISMHTTYLIRVPFNYVVYIMSALFIYLFIIGLFLVKRKKYKRRIYKILSRFFSCSYVLCAIVSVFLLYGPYKNFRDWFISTAMSTMNHQYLCKWFYSKKEIDDVLNNNYIKEVNEDTDTNLIKLEEETTYENEYEKQILKRNKNAKYKVIELKVNGQKGYLAAIYDPSKLKVAVTSYLGVKGEYVTDMAEKNDALIAINGGGFYDPGYVSTGGSPTGITISNGKVITNNTYGTYNQGGGIIGLTNDNKLVLNRNKNAYTALNSGIRDAISWGPFLIVNGKKSFIKGNGGWGYAARTAIGQRKDGIILLLVVDSNSSRTKGADMVNLTEIMSNYGAINAANLDGGTSSVMVLPKKEALKYNNKCSKNYCNINDPIDGRLRHQTRRIATSIILTK